MWLFRRSVRFVLSIGLAILFAMLSILRVPQMALSQISHSLTSPVQPALIAANTAQEVEQEFKQRFICVKTSEELSLKYVGVMGEEQIRTTIVRPLANQLKPCIEQNRSRIGTVDVKKLINVVYTTRKINSTTAVVVVGVGVSNNQVTRIPPTTPPGATTTKPTNPPGGSPGQTPPTTPPGATTTTNPVEVPGKPRPGVVKPVSQVEGVLQIFSSTLPNCKVGNYALSGKFDQSFSQLTLTSVEGAENCFTSLPTQLFSAPGLSDGGATIAFESPVAPGNRRIAGSVSRIYGSFTVPIAYLESPETFGLLILNSKNTKVSDPSGPQLNNQTTILTQLPAPPTLKISEVLPDLLIDEKNPPLWVEDQRSNSETQGLTVARNLIQVVYADETTVDELNSGLAAVGGGIVSSYEGGTVMTLKIPDTGDLDGLDNVRRILQLQPKVITVVPVIRKEVPKPPSLSLSLQAEPSATPPQLIPQPLQLVGAIDADGQRPDAPLGQGNVNLFIVDWFSDPVHPDVNLLNPIFQKTYELPFQPYLGFLDRIASVKHLFKAIPPINKALHTDAQGFLISKGWWCENTGFLCPQRIQGTSATPEKLDKNGHANVAIFDPKNQAHNGGNVKNSHGYLVAGLMAARNNTQGVAGMYPDANARIFAYNALGDVLNDRLLYTLQNTSGLHIVNFSGGLVNPSEEVSRKDGVFWATQIRQRKLENRVVFIQAGGNASDRSNNKIVPAENNGTWSAAGLRDDLSNVTESKRRECGNVASRAWRAVSSGDPCKTVTDQVRVNIPRLSNILVVEALDVTGNYANYSNGVSNSRLAVRAIGHQSTVDPALSGVQACVSPNNANSRDPGFPSLTSDQRITCMEGGGTSSAAPQVAGLAAWLWSREPNLSASQVAQRIIQNQTPFQVLDQNGRRAVNSNRAPIMSQVTAINVPQTLGVTPFSLTGQPTTRPSPRPTPRPANPLVVKDINLTVGMYSGACSPDCSSAEVSPSLLEVNLPISTVQQFYTIPPGDELADLTWDPVYTQNFKTTPEGVRIAVSRTQDTFQVARFTVKTKRGRSGTGTVSITIQRR